MRHATVQVADESRGSSYWHICLLILVRPLAVHRDACAGSGIRSRPVLGLCLSPTRLQHPEYW
jgi:hypothetical protein